MTISSATQRFLLILVCLLAFASASQAQPYEVYCQDGIDNDGDNRIDTNPAGTPVGNLGPDPDCQCFDETVNASFQCTAGDLAFVIVGLGTQTDGCVNASDTVGIQFGATLGTTGDTRYDAGMWVALDGGNARTGKCARQMLVPAINFGSVPNASQLDSGNGPFRNSDNDVCGDVVKTDDPSGGGAPIAYNARYNFKDLNTGPSYLTQPVYNLSCGSTANGFLNVSTCVSYDNNSNTTCNSLGQAVPGTGSKCRCQGPPDFRSNIPVPNLALSCGCTLNANGTVTCEMTYSNLGQGTCTQVSSAGETEFSCGTARYIRFKTSYPDADGDVTIGPSSCIPQTSGTTTANCPAGPGRAVPTDDGVGTITWVPKSDNGAGSGTNGWVGVNEAERLRFTFTQTSPGPKVLTFPTVAEWANNASFTGAVAQTALTCSANLTTPVTLSTFEARPEGDEIVLEWQTATETGNAGFHVEADAGAGRVRLTDLPVPSAKVDSLEPQTYELRVPAEGLEQARFYLEETSVDGVSRRHGPFEQGARLGAVEDAEPTDWTAIRREHEARRSQDERRAMRAVAVESAAAGQGSAGAGGPRQYPAANLFVTEAGIQRIGYETLAAAGADYAGVKATDLMVESGGAPVPVYVGGARTFGPGSYLEFVGRPVDTLYTGTNVYTVRVDRRAVRAGVDTTAPNAGAAAAPYYLETTRVERNLEYGTGAPGGDPWFERSLFSWGAPSSDDFQVTLDNVASGAAPSRLRVETWGSTIWPQEPDHHVVARFNGAQVAERTFDGRVVDEFEVELPAGSVTEGTNTLTLVQPGDTGAAFEITAFEAFAVQYPRAFVAKGNRLAFTAAGARFQVSGFTQPNVVVYRESAGALTQLAGAVVSPAPGGYGVSVPGSATPATYYLAASGAQFAPGVALARDPASLQTGPAELLVIAHPDFIGGLAPLVQARRNQGYSVKVVDLRDVYARESHDVVDPEAIRRYVAFAHGALGTRYVLLVGGDTYDYRGYSGTGSIGFLPSIYARTGPYVSFAPVDPLVGDVDGDGRADLPVGRFPVRTAGELDDLVGKTLAYDVKSYSGTAVLAADSYDAPSATSFSVMSDELAAPLGESWSLTRAYVDHDGVALAKSKLVGAIESGVALTTFVGHSGPTRWTFQGLFQSSDAAALGNSGAPTVVSQFGCWNAYYVSPTYDGLAHRLLLSGDRGAAAVLGATTLTETASDREFAPLLTARLATPGTTVGDALQQARSALAAGHPEMIDVLLGFTLLGDPTLVVEP